MTTSVTSQPPDLAAPEPENLYSEIEALCQLVRLGQGRFTLALVEYDLPRTRAEVMAHLHEQFPALNVVEAELSPPPPAAPTSYNVLDQLKNVVEAASPGKPPDVLICTGLETLFPQAISATDDGQMSDELRRAIQPLNLGRNLLADMFPCPVLLFLPKAAMEIVLTSAPDIVSWKSGFFIFETDPQAVRAELSREAAVETGWLAYWRLRRLPPDELASESRRLKALLADARALPAGRTVIVTLHNRLGWTAVALGDGSEAQKSFAEMLRLARDINDPGLIKAAERGLRRAERLQVKRRKALKHTPTRQQSFRGAAALSMADGLFGREAELQELLLQLTRVGNRFVTVWGETGCGKTSLVLAGVVPELERQGHLSIVVREWEHPRAAICNAIESACDSSLTITDSLRDWLQAAAQRADKPIVIICDQFEQFFTKHPQRQEREPLLKEIGTCLNDFRLPCKFIFILREDYLGRMVELEKHVGDALDKNKRFYLSLFDQATALRVMRQLSDKAGLNWPDVFLNEVIKDLTRDGQVRPIELQLVGAALVTLDINDEQAYSRAGRAEGLLTDYLQATLESLSKSKREMQDYKRVLLALIEEPHQRLSLTALEIEARSEVHYNLVREKLNKLIDSNLVAGPEKDQPEQVATISTYQLMHDVLVDAVLRLTRDIQDSHRQARKILTRALEDLRVKPRQTISLREQRLLRNYLPAKIKDEPNVKALLNRSLLLGRAKWVVAILLIALLLLLLIQNTGTYIRIDRDRDPRLVIHRGLPGLRFLPLLGDKVLIDTGFTISDFDPEKRDIVQEAEFWESDNQSAGAMGDKRFYESLDSPVKQAWLLCVFGRKAEGLQKLGAIFAANRSGLTKYSSYRAAAIRALATAIKADPSLAESAFGDLIPVFSRWPPHSVRIVPQRYERYEELYGEHYQEAATALVAAIKAYPALARPAFDSLRFFFNEAGYYRDDSDKERIVGAASVLAAAIKADPALARRAFDAVLPVLTKRQAGNLEVMGQMLEAAIQADPTLARPAFDALLPALKRNIRDYVRYSLLMALAAAAKADPALARPAFDAVFPTFKGDSSDLDPEGPAIALATIIKADPTLARRAFDALLPPLTKYQTGNPHTTGLILEAVIKADPTLARPAFNTLLLALKGVPDHISRKGLVMALVAAIKADPTLARPAFDSLLFVQGEEIRPQGEIVAAAINADPSLVNPVLERWLPAAKKSSPYDYNIAKVSKDSISLSEEFRNTAALELTKLNRFYQDGFAKYLAKLAREEARNGRDPVQFLFDHLEGRRSLLPNGNANTYAVYRQVVQKAMAQWIVSKTPEAAATQATLKQRLETMRDQEVRLHLRLAAWETLATAADLRDERDSDNFEDFDQ